MRFVVVLVIGVFFSFYGSAQALKTAGAMVTFDPLFWKDNLKLTDDQYKAIQRINSTYYESIYRLIDEHPGEIAYLQHATAKLLQDRSERIWNTFRARQKKKWDKLSSSYLNDESNTTMSRLPSDLYQYHN